MPGVGEESYFSMLNVFGKGLKNTRCLRDRLDAGQSLAKYYQVSCLCFFAQFLFQR